MKISYNWLKSYVQTDLSAEEAAKILTDIGLEVEGVERIEAVKGGLEGLVIGEVLTCEKHPDADKLHVTTVEFGEGPVQIVCGAPNVAAGEKVVVATIGATLYPTGSDESFKIKKSKIRGVESFGMLCAEDEIGLGTAHDGIMLLDDTAKPGTPAKDYFKLNEDTVFEIGLTPNRADAASHWGVARDLAAWLQYKGIGGKAQLPSVDGFAIDNESRVIPVKVENGWAAPRYTGITVSGVKIAPSPQWLQERLRAIGINPHNNVVDITNFILHELGQPLHSFDADRIAGGEVIVRCAEEGTPFVTLDGVERKLSAEDLMICDREKPMCIAGVFGGMESGITEETKNVFLESAYFNPVSIRKTAKRHGLNTDASFRYERGTDPNMPLYALKRAALLIKELAGGEISSPVIDCSAGGTEPFKVELSIDKCNRLIGKEIGKENIKRILNGLDIRIVKEEGDLLSLEVPPYRVDVQRDVDVIEDIMRIYGYNNIEIPLSVRSTLSYAPQPDRDKIANTISDFLSANGFNEIMSNSLTKASYYEGNADYPAERCVKIMNPLSNDLNVMRQTLLYNMLEAIQLNTNHQNTDLKLYEFGNCYFYNEERRTEENPLAAYREEYRMAMAVTGLEKSGSWNEKAEKSTLFTLKGIAGQMFKRFGLNLDEATYTKVESKLFGEAAAVKLRGKNLFTFGTVAKGLRKAFDLKNEVFYLEMNMQNFIAAVQHNSLTAAELSKFPAVSRDLALLVDKQVTFAQLRSVAFKTEKSLLRSVSLFDVYEGEKLPEGKKSYALNFVLEDTTKTLTDNVIEKVMKSLEFQFEKQLGAKIRS